LIETRRRRGLGWAALWATTLTLCAITGAVSMAVLRALSA